VGAEKERPRGPIGWPRAAWAKTETIKDAAEEVSLFKRRWAVLPLRIVGFLMLLAMLPFRAVIARYFRQRPPEQLKRHARQVWRTSPEEARALVRAAYDKLEAAHRSGTLGVVKGKVEIAPYGRFGEIEEISVKLLLYELELRLGHFEEALALIGAVRTSTDCLRRVACLLGLRRRDEAIALLRASLPVDDRRGRLQAKLLELDGSVRDGLN
jgi:hypothetical protein